MKAELGAHRSGPSGWSRAAPPGPSLQVAGHSHMAEAQSAEPWLLGFNFLGIPLMLCSPQGWGGERGKMIHIVTLNCGKRRLHFRKMRVQRPLS